MKEWAKWVDERYVYHSHENISLMIFCQNSDSKCDMEEAVVKRHCQQYTLKMGTMHSSFEFGFQRFGSTGNSLGWVQRMEDRDDENEDATNYGQSHLR